MVTPSISTDLGLAAHATSTKFLKKTIISYDNLGDYQSFLIVFQKIVHGENREQAFMKKFSYSQFHKRDFWNQFFSVYAAVGVGSGDPTWKSSEGSTCVG